MADDPPTMHLHISVYADIALKEPIAVHFDNEEYLSPEECRKALLRFRNSFSALKAKDRREQARFFQPPLYERIGCFVEETPTGWVANIRSNIQRPSRVTKANGEPLPQFQPDYPRWRKLQNRTTEVRRGEPCPWSPEDVEFFWEFDPKMARLVFEDMGWPLPSEKGN